MFACGSFFFYTPVVEEDKKSTQVEHTDSFRPVPVALEIGVTIAVPIVLLALAGRFADKTFLLPIYFAREKDDGSVSSEKLMKAVKANGGEGQSFPSFGDAEDYIKSLNLGKNDVLVTMGAGEAYKVTDKVLNFT